MLLKIASVLTLETYEDGPFGSNPRRALREPSNEQSGSRYMAISFNLFSGGDPPEPPLSFGGLLGASAGGAFLASSRF